jgi:hypothetical protein
MAQRVIEEKHRPKLVQLPYKVQQDMYNQQVVRHTELINRFYKLKQELREAERQAGCFATVMWVLGAVCIAEFIVFWFIW